MTRSASMVAMAAVLLLVLPQWNRQVDGGSPDKHPKDWPMYNCDLIGTHYNRGETAIDKLNAGRLEEKWRFPAKGSDLEIGVIHATPVVVDGYVYFGTATDAAFYKLTPDGTVRWSYRNPARPQPQGQPKDETARQARFQTSLEGILGSALVAQDAVFFGDIGGWFYALDRATIRALVVRSTSG